MRPDSPSALKVSWLLVEAMRLWLFTHATLQQHETTRYVRHTCDAALGFDMMHNLHYVYNKGMPWESGIDHGPPCTHFSSPDPSPCH
jgi:hypothetical protein